MDQELKKAYDQGLSDAWKALRKISTMDIQTQFSIFREYGIENILAYKDVHEIMNVIGDSIKNE